MQADRVRFTIAVDPEVHQAFSDLAHVSGVSLSRLVGDWLRDTSEAAHLTALQLQEVRKSPSEAFMALVAPRVSPDLVRGLVEANGAVSRARGGIPLAGGNASAGNGRVSVASPPSSNTGGKVPRKNPNKSPKTAGGR